MLDEYQIVIKNNLGQITYSGVGFTGQSEDVLFIERFKPVNPSDIDNIELANLLSLCPAGTKASIGYIQ